MADAKRFLEGVHQHLEASAGVGTEDVFVRITFADGTVKVTSGLNASAAMGTAGWGMIEGAGPEMPDPIVIREGSVLKVQFQLASPTPSPPIGYLAESQRENRS